VGASTPDPNWHPGNSRLMGANALGTARTLLGQSQAIHTIVADHGARIVKNHGDRIDATWLAPQRLIRGPRSSTG
jgi:hypothetical protein